MADKKLDEIEYYNPSSDVPLTPSSPGTSSDSPIDRSEQEKGTSSTPQEMTHMLATKIDPRVDEAVTPGPPRKLPPRAPMTYNKLRLTMFPLALIAILILVLICFLRCDPKREVERTLVRVIPKPRYSKDSRPLIDYRYKHRKGCENHVNAINAALDPYREAHPSRVNCTFDRLPGVNETCIVDISSFGACSQDNAFFYTNATPCIFLQFGKNSSFIPKYVDVANAKSSRLGPNIAAKIRNTIGPYEPEKLSTIWVECKGETEYDSTLLGKIEYEPMQGFPGYFFPYRNQTAYLEPLIAVRFAKVTVGKLINVDCNVMAMNFNETVKFALLIYKD